MFSSPGSIVPLPSLTPLVGPVATDILPIQRSSPMQSVTVGDLQAFVINSVKAYGAMGDGVTDDTGAIQSAINAGAPFYFPAGVYVTSSTLTFTTVNAHGQIVRGAGPTAGNGTGGAKVVIRPGAGVSIAILIDGTPFNGYIQGFGLEGLTIDMVNMSDVVDSIAVNQVQAFDIAYRNVRVIN